MLKSKLITKHKTLPFPSFSSPCSHPFLVHPWRIFFLRLLDSLPLLSETPGTQKLVQGSPNYLQAPKCCQRWRKLRYLVNVTLITWIKITYIPNKQFSILARNPKSTHSEKPFHLRKNSTFPLTTRWSITFSTTNSSTSWASFFDLPPCFLPIST